MCRWTSGSIWILASLTAFSSSRGPITRHRPSGPPSIDERAHRRRQHLQLELVDPFYEAVPGLAVVDLERLLPRDRPYVEVSAYQMDRYSRLFDPVLQDVSDGVGSGKRWKERMVHLHDPVRVRMNRSGPDDPREAGNDDVVDRMLLQHPHQSDVEE